MGDLGLQWRELVTPPEVDRATPYICLVHVPRRTIALAAWDRAEFVTSSKFRFRNGDVLRGKLRPYFHEAGPAPVDGVCAPDVVVLHANETGPVRVAIKDRAIDGAVA